MADPRECVFILPSVSDGTFRGDGEATRPNDCDHGLQLYQSLYQHVSRHAWSDKALQTLGTWLARLSHYQSNIMNSSYALSAMPAGYCLFVTPEQGIRHAAFHILGHPSGRCFETLQDFAQHLIWLYGRERRMDEGCDCPLCRGRSMSTQAEAIWRSESVGAEPQYQTVAGTRFDHPFVPAPSTALYPSPVPMVAGQVAAFPRAGISFTNRHAPPPALRPVSGNVYANGVASAPLDRRFPAHGLPHQPQSFSHSAPPTLADPASALVARNLQLDYEQSQDHHVLQSIVAERDCYISRLQLYDEDIRRLHHRMQQRSFQRTFGSASDWTPAQSAQLTIRPLPVLQTTYRATPITTTTMHPLLDAQQEQVAPTMLPFTTPMVPSQSIPEQPQATMTIPEVSFTEPSSTQRQNPEVAIPCHTSPTALRLAADANIRRTSGGRVSKPSRGKVRRAAITTSRPVGETPVPASTGEAIGNAGPMAAIRFVPIITQPNVSSVTGINHESIALASIPVAGNIDETADTTSNVAYMANAMNAVDGEE